MSSDEETVKKIVLTVPKPILTKIYSYKVNRATVSHSETLEDRNQTSKFQQFNPPVDIPEALMWLVGLKFIEGALTFENGTTLILKDGKFDQFVDPNAQ